MSTSGLFTALFSGNILTVFTNCWTSSIALAWKKIHSLQRWGHYFQVFVTTCAVAEDGIFILYILHLYILSEVTAPTVYFFTRAPVLQINFSIFSWNGIFLQNWWIKYMLIFFKRRAKLDFGQVQRVVKWSCTTGL
jgi:hypothetical protein